MCAVCGIDLVLLKEHTLMPSISLKITTKYLASQPVQFQMSIAQSHRGLGRLMGMMWVWKKGGENKGGNDVHSHSHRVNLPSTRPPTRRPTVDSEVGRQVIVSDLNEVLSAAE